MSIAEEFTQRVQQLHADAEERGESVYGMKPWYCSVERIEKGASIAFIGVRPAG